MSLHNPVLNGITITILIIASQHLTIEEYWCQIMRLTWIPPKIVGKRIGVASMLDRFTPIILASNKIYPDC